LDIQPIDKIRYAERIISRLSQAGFEAYLVGGCVRDFVRGVSPGDYDIVTSAMPDQVQALFEHTVPIGASFGIILVIEGHHTYEVATFRRDGPYPDGRHPSCVCYTSVREDVLRRDFTINGLLMDPTTGQILDYVNGRADIQKKIVRSIGDPVVRFNEDYLRMLRAIRFAANLDFSLDNATKEAIQQNAVKIRKISAERIREELDRLFTRGGSRRGFELLAETGILKHILPEADRMRGVTQSPRFHPEGDVWQHTMIMLDIYSQERCSDADSTLAWAVLLHDVGKPATQTEDANGIHFYGHVEQGRLLADDVMKRLRFPRMQRENILDLISQHMNFMNVRKMRPGRLKRFLRMPLFHLHLTLHRLDCLASHAMLDNYEFCRLQLQNLKDEELHPPRLITGHDLLAMGFIPGKQIGEILRVLEEEQLENRLHHREEALAFVRERWK